MMKKKKTDRKSMMMKKKDKRMIEMKTGYLCEELLEEIFAYVHLKPLTRMKCVSKDWCHLISHITKSRPRVNPIGLILTEESFSKEDWNGDYIRTITSIKLFDVEVRGGELEYLEKNALSFFSEGLVKYWCYSNGLLLCSDLPTMSIDLMLYDLLRLEQSISLPSVAEFYSRLWAGVGVGCLANGEFKLVCFDFDFDKSIEVKCVIFSSETRAWRKHKPRFSNYSTGEYYKSFLQNECLFYEGLMYWALYDYLFIYNLLEDIFEIHDLPTKKEGWERGDIDIDECLWVSEGCLHYACSVEDVFSVWTRFQGVEINSDYDEYYQNEDNRLIPLHFKICPSKQHTSRWILKHRVDFKTLKKQHPELFPKKSDEISFHKPCAFHEDFQILYLKISGSVVTYSFETGCLKKVKVLAAP